MANDLLWLMIYYCYSNVVLFFYLFFVTAEKEQIEKVKQKYNTTL